MLATFYTSIMMDKNLLYDRDGIGIRTQYLRITSSTVLLISLPGFGTFTNLNVTTACNRMYNDLSSEQPGHLRISACLMSYLEFSFLIT